MDRTNDRTAIVDSARSVDLDDVGLIGTELAVCVTSDGEVHFALIDVGLLGSDAGYDPSARTAPHEQLGALPEQYARRIDALQPRCGRRAKSGVACRTPVAHQGDSCFWHGGAR
jgi:hypothetical protein